MDRHNQAACSAAYLVKWRADWLAGVGYREPEAWSDLLRVPPRWTAWLLMDRAGVPLDLIAYMAGIKEKRLRRALRFASALMVFPPYAAKIEQLGAQVESFALLEVQISSSAERAVRCAA